MMPYIAPDIHELSESIEAIRKTYQQELQRPRGFIDYLGINPAKETSSRLDLINLIMIIKEEFIADRHDKLLGIMIFALEKINAEYHYISAECQTHLFGLFSTGSKLNGILQQSLKIHPKNPLSDGQRVIYLAKIWNYLENLRDAQLQFSAYRSVRGLRDDIKQTIQIILQRSQQKNMNELRKESPAEAALKDSFSEIPVKYLATKNQQITDLDKDKESDLTLIDNINHASQQCPLDGIELPINHPRVQSLNAGYVLRYSCLLYLMLKIEKSYYLRQPNSELYKLCQQATHLSSTEDLDVSLRYYYYTALEFLFPTTIAEKKILLAEKSRLLDTMGNTHPILNSISQAITFGTAFGLNTAIGVAVASYVTVPVNQRFISSAAQALVKRNGGNYLSQCSAYTMGRTAENFAATTIVSKTLQHSAHSFTQIPAFILFYAMKIPLSVTNYISECVFTPEDNTNYRTKEYIGALLSLPDDLVSASHKIILRRLDSGMYENAYHTKLGLGN